MVQDGKRHAKSSDGYQRTRRRLLKASAAGIATSTLAGCSGNNEQGTGDDGSGSSGGSSGSGIVDKSWVGQTWFNPEQIKWNPWSLNFPYNPSTWLYECFGAMHALADPPEDQILYLYDEKTWDGDTLTLKLKDGFKWHNGDDVTAEDLLTQLKIEKHARANTVMSFAYDEWRLMDSVSQVDGLTLEIESPGYNHQVLERLLTNGGGHGPRLLANRNVFRENLEAIEGATTDSEREDAVTELRQRQIDEPIGNGPFKFAEQSSSRIKLKRFEDHPAADQINWTGGEFQFFSDNQAYTSAIMSGKIDGTWGTSDRAKVKSYPEHMKTWLVEPVYGCWSLNFNHDHEFFQDRRVRQAIAYAIDKKAIARLIGGLRQKPREKATGLHDIASSNPGHWIGDKYENYRSYDTDPEKGASLLRDAGYSKDGKWWTDSSGKTFAVKMIADSEVAERHRAVASRLKDFGINVTLQALEGATYQSRVQAGDFELILSQPEGWLPHPYFALMKVFGFNAHWVGDNGYPDEVEVPMPVGDFNGSTETLKPKELMKQLEQAQSEEEERDAIQKLTWIVNVDLPLVGMTDYGDDLVMSNDGWEFPTQGLSSKKSENPVGIDHDKINKHLTAKWPIEWLALRSGEFRATE